MHWKTLAKRAVWSIVAGFLFRRIVANKVAFERVFRRTIPNSIMLFPTNLCNALCSFCAYPTNTDPKKSMPNEIAFKAIDDFFAMGGGNVVDFTTNLGDPLIDPTLPDKLAYAKKRGATTTFYTNGILLDRDGLIEKIAPNLDDLHVSLPGLDRQNYIQMFKVDKAEKVRRGLVRLAMHKLSTGFPREVYLEFRINRPIDDVMRDEGMPQIAEYIDAGIFKVGRVIDTFDTWGGAISPTEDFVVKDGKSKKSIPCGALFVNPGVMPDGRVRACSCWYIKTNYDSLTLESVTEKPLGDILFGDSHRKVLSDWMDGDLPPPCRQCSNYSPVWFSPSRLTDMAKAAISATSTT